MKHLITFLLLFNSQLVFGIELTNKSDKEIEKMLIGSWFFSQIDSDFINNLGNAISTYTEQYDVFHITFIDQNCKKPIIKTKGKWKVKNKQLILTVESSTNPLIHPRGLVVIDNIISINKKDKVLMGIDSKNKQFRTKNNTCNIQEIRKIRHNLGGEQFNSKLLFANNVP